MYIMRNLPGLLGLIVGVIISLSGIYYGWDFKEISGRLVIGITLFYIFGVIIKNNFFNYLVRILEKEEEKVREERQREYNELMKKKNEMRQNIKTTVEKNEEELEPFLPNKLQ